MNLENYGFLNWRGWSVVRKAQVLGALSGALLTVGITGLGMTAGPHEPFTPIDVAYMFMVLPIIQIYKVFGLTFWLSTDHGAGHGLAVIPCCLMVMTNSFLFFLVGTVIGWIVNAHRGHAGELRGNAGRSQEP